MSIDKVTSKDAQMGRAKRGIGEVTSREHIDDATRCCMRALLDAGGRESQEGTGKRKPSDIKVCAFIYLCRARVSQLARPRDDDLQCSRRADWQHGDSEGK